MTSPDPKLAEVAAAAERASSRPAGGPLAGLRVGLSGAVPEREAWGSSKDLDQVILRFVAHFTALLVKYGGQVVHGNQPGFVPVVAAQASAFRRRASPVASAGTGKPMVLVSSALWGEQPGLALRKNGVADVIVTAQVGPGGVDNLQTRNDSLTAMRLVMASRVDAVVAVGGKLHNQTGRNPGVLEELTVARWRGVPCVVVGAFGGLVGKIDEGILRRFSAGNGMEDSAVQAIAKWDGDADVDQHVGMILAHLARHHRKPDAPAATQWPRVHAGERVQSFAMERSFTPDVPPVLHADVPDELIRASSKQFGGVLEAFHKSDVDKMEALLAKPPF